MHCYFPLNYGYRYIFFTLLQNYKSYYLNIILLNSFTWSCNNHAKFIQLFTNFWNIKSSNFLFKFSPYYDIPVEIQQIEKFINPHSPKSNIEKHIYWLCTFALATGFTKIRIQNIWAYTYIVQNEITWYRYTSIGDTD